MLMPARHSEMRVATTVSEGGGGGEEEELSVVHIAVVGETVWCDYRPEWSSIVSVFISR